MGKEVLYCTGCGQRLLEEDFTAGRGFPVLNRYACSKCLANVVAQLPPEDKRRYEAAHLTPAPGPAEEETPQKPGGTSTKLKALHAGATSTKLKAAKGPVTPAGAHKTPSPGPRGWPAPSARGGRKSARPATPADANKTLFLLIAISSVAVVVLVLFFLFSKVGRPS